MRMPSQWCPIGACETSSTRLDVRASQNPVRALGAPTLKADGLTSPVLAFQKSHGGLYVSQFRLQVGFQCLNY